MVPLYPYLTSLQTLDALPTWMAVPVEVEFTVGGQQPDQLVSAGSNVYIHYNGDLGRRFDVVFSTINVPSTYHLHTISVPLMYH